MDAMAESAFELRTHESLRDLGEAAYRSLTDEDTPPFLRFEWLDALERTGCVAPERGWLPMHLSLHSGGELVAAAPAYVKGNSEGEFVFDHAWARFAQTTLGVRYYPKLVVAVPFTPATGPRVLMRKGAPRENVLAAFASGLSELCERARLSSAHVLFPPADEAEALAERGLQHRHGVQYHWHNAGYADFDAFLARFDSKRRHQIKRERRELAERGVSLEVLTGDSLSVADADFVFDFYGVTIDKFPWGRRYLCREFFEEVLATMPEALHVVVAKERASGKRLAGAFNLLGKNALYGRYWGALVELPFLHFNVCFYEGIEDAIRRGLALFEPGAGGEHKLSRGFEPTITHSVHHLGDERLSLAIEDFLRRERAAVRAEIAGAAPVLKPRT
jgi:predicted N-acyltransferase